MIWRHRRAQIDGSGGLDREQKDIAKRIARLVAAIEMGGE